MRFLSVTSGWNKSHKRQERGNQNRDYQMLFPHIDCIIISFFSRGGGNSWDFLVGVCRRVLQKNVIFRTRFQTSPLKSVPVFQTWPLGRNYVLIT